METIVVGERLDYLEDISNRLLARVTRDAPGPTEERLTWNTPIANGYASSVLLRDGMEMQVTNIVGRLPWKFNLLHQPRGLELGFSRRCGIQVMTPDGSDLGVCEGNFCISHVKEASSFHCESRGHGEDQGVSVQLDPNGLVSALGLCDLPEAFQAVLDDTKPYALNHYRMNSSMYRIVDDLLQSELRGPMRRLYFESKALELLVLATEATTPKIRSSCSSLTRQEIDRLEHARSLLLTTFAHPPTLRTLARSCGLNERKLKEGFKERFGTTVFAYVRSQRMARAHDMLASSSHSVTEVAQLVGYANPSKFAAAFRREFGVCPSSVASA